MFIQKKLKQKIRHKRQEMVKLGLDNGLTSKEVVKCSQELDQLLNLYMDVSEKKVA